MNQFLKILFVVLISTVKFTIVAPIAIFEYKLTLIESIFYNTVGGIVGIFVFYFLSKELLLGWHILKAKFFGKQKHHYHQKHLNRPRFTTLSRRLVNIKQRWGLIGLVVSTPCILSIPLGTFIAAKYYPGKHTIAMLCAAVVAWSILINVSVYLVGKVF